MNTCTEDLPGVTPVLGADLLGRTRDLNRDYLELLILEHLCPDISGMRYLPDRVLDALARTTHETREFIATAKFALYSLGFENHEFWRTALRLDQRDIDGRYGVLSTAVVQSSFCEIALLHAWHVAITEPIAASLLYGMPQPVIELMMSVQLWQLRRVAVDYPGLLMPRWPTNPCFWSDLLKYASSRDLRRLETIQHLGRQLIAIDLQSSGTHSAAVRVRRRNLMQRRLGRPRD